ncbi:hypothetical protein P691DRAFT_672505 [Macrolepiota fuliginosa MF-IS2]|uniref:Uncharacterized protein n=1 Tax=Macrolepiota fuliginosa MF-IS2 TaxID=1400762 RepID=A0A9P5X9J8_9AGAR|nr:hypothetical protein P691DRAFT_672505 [Macrolepiota fuliginosa MF-IS2]
MQQKGIRGEKQFLIETHAERVNGTMTKKFNELIKERKCDPKWTIPISALVQAPPYIALSMILSRVAADPLTPLRSESFLTLTSLAHSDPTMTLPIVLGIISMANVDTRNWWLSAAEREREKKYHEWKAAKAERQGKPYVQSPLKNVLRGLSVVRIGLAMLVPGNVQLYWVASAGLGLVQTIAFDFIDNRRRRRVAAQEALIKEAKAASTKPLIRLKK